MLILLTCEDCGLQYHFGIGAIFGGAMNLRCNCGGSLHDPEFESNFSQGERRKEMRDSKPYLYVEVECKDCHRTYWRYLHELDLVFQSKYQRAFVINCSFCGFERVVIISAHPETVGGQVAELRYPLINLEDISNLGRDAFMRAVRKRVAGYVNLHDDISPAEMRLSDFFSQAEIDYEQVAERKRISADGPLPLVFATFEFFHRDGTLGGCGGPWPWETSREEQL